MEAVGEEHCKELKNNWIQFAGLYISSLLTQLVDNFGEKTEEKQTKTQNYLEDGFYLSGPSTQSLKYRQEELKESLYNKQIIGKRVLANSELCNIIVTYE